MEYVLFQIKDCANVLKLLIEERCRQVCELFKFILPKIMLVTINDTEFMITGLRLSQREYHLMFAVFYDVRISCLCIKITVLDLKTGINWNISKAASCFRPHYNRYLCYLFFFIRQTFCSVTQELKFKQLKFWRSVDHLIYLMQLYVFSTVAVEI